MSLVSADADTLVRQASMTAAEYLDNGIRYIDDAFGDGYAKQHPELVAAFIRASAQDFHTAIMAQAIENAIGNALMLAPWGEKS
jgi:hypothetical protein